MEHEASSLQSQIAEHHSKLNEITTNYDHIYQDMVERTKKEALDAVAEEIAQRQGELEAVTSRLESTQTELAETESDRSETQKKLDSAAGRLVKVNSTLKAIRAGLKRFSEAPDFPDRLPSQQEESEFDNLLSATVEVHFNAMDVRELRKRLSQNKATVKDTLKRYQGRYTTKANIAIYRLMVIGLEAELQNVVVNLKYDKLEKALSNIREIIAKYEVITAEGNKQIAPTIKKFLGEIQYLYEEAVNIEYQYYVKRERAKEEQRAIRQQMREEAAERKRLMEEQHKIAAEESKYLSELETLRAQLAEAQDDLKRQQIDARMDELKGQLDQVEEKKEGILRLQHGKAGYVYVISNLGSFGENVFKIGMTRRLNPQDRVDELGDASVPFRFDVHCLVFSNDAPSIENGLHRKLNDKRLNKINLRREFFVSSVDELEEMVYELEPSAEFSRTMLAEEFRQSMETTEVPEFDESLDYDNYDDEEDEDEEETLGA
ncbi:MAG: GIY-YIG nuclease family protein [Alkalispirochaeta sp.]